MLRRLSVIIIAAILWQFSSSLTLAKTHQPQQPDKYPPSPLEVITSDPLLPPMADKHQLSLEELQKLEVELDKLNQAAGDQLETGNKEAAFETWNRELRLRRFLGQLSEIQALSRVGAIAANENNRPEVLYITQRLQAIQKQALAQTKPDLELWRSLGQAYQKVRSPKLALEVYDQILAVVRQQQDATAELATLNTIGEVHLSWFDYTKAAATYQELLSLASTKGDSLNEVVYLKQLAYIYEQDKQHKEAVNILNKLGEIYQNQNDLTQLPELKLAIASNYESLARENPSLLPEAFQKYQEAYTSAWQLEQYVNASEALQKLIALYRSQGQIDEALQTSQILLQAEAKTTNFYGMMQTYDQIGQIYLGRKQYSQARAAFQQGLELAQQLKHEEDYFTQQIETLSKQNL